MRATTPRMSLLVVLCSGGIIVAVGHGGVPAGMLIPAWTFRFLLALLAGDLQSLVDIEFICLGLFCLAVACYIVVFSLNARANTTYFVGFVANALLICFVVLLIRWSESRLLSAVTAIPFFVSVVIWGLYARKQMYVQAAEHVGRLVERSTKNQ